jgi:hypothetical protein
MSVKEDLAARVADLEKRLVPIERLFRTAIGHDPCIDEDTEILRNLIVQAPGMSQAGICKVARARHDLSRPRVVEVLRSGVGMHWLVQGGMYNALLYFPMENAYDTHVKGNTVQVISTSVDSTHDGVNAGWSMTYSGRSRS